MRSVPIWSGVFAGTVLSATASLFAAACYHDCVVTTLTCWKSAGNGAQYDEYNPAIAGIMWCPDGYYGSPDNEFAGQGRGGQDINAGCPCDAEAEHGELQEGDVGLSGDWVTTTYAQYCNTDLPPS